MALEVDWVGSLEYFGVKGFNPVDSDSFGLVSSVHGLIRRPKLSDFVLYALDHSFNR